MLRAAKLIAIILAASLLLLAVLVASIGRDGVLRLVLGPVEYAPVSFETLLPGDRPNRYLVCPEDLCAAEPDRISPLFEIPAEALRDRWIDMVAAQPRVTELASDPERLQHEFIQRSKVLSFPDSITVRFIPRGEGRSTLAVYSRSHYGYDDFGVNRQRIDAWLALLEIERGNR